MPITATLSGLSAGRFTDNDDIEIAYFDGGDLAEQDSTCVEECQANDACFAFDETADGECAASLAADFRSKPSLVYSFIRSWPNPCP